MIEPKLVFSLSVIAVIIVNVFLLACIPLFKNTDLEDNTNNQEIEEQDSKVPKVVKATVTLIKKK
ncbi:hypothetical protein P9X10_00830 [Bacillus cereus]|nr:hypothetical protein [Bacillus cereus]